MKGMYLTYFTHDDNLPFFIQYGHHEGFMFQHTHEDFYELVIVLDGSAEHIIYNKQTTVSKGDVFLVGSNIPHEYNNAANFRIYNIMFKPEQIFKHKYDIDKIAGFSDMFEQHDGNFKNHLKLANHDYHNVITHVKSILTEYDNRADGWYSMIISEFFMLTGILSRLYYKVNTNISDEKNLSSAVSFIENHYAENITVETLTEISHYSTRQLNRIFNKSYGISPMDYIITVRMREACKLLLDNKLSVSDIAAKCGFSSSNYFGRIFKQKMGVTPKEYRESENIKYLETMDKSCSKWFENE